MNKKLILTWEDAKRLGVTSGKVLFDAKGHKTEVYEIEISKVAGNTTVDSIIDRDPFARFTNN